MKLEIGKQYKTRGGWRAVVVDFTKDFLFPAALWHQNKGLVYHSKKGMASKLSVNQVDYDLVSEWTEPRRLEGWVNVYPYGFGTVHATKEHADHDEQGRIGVKHIVWVEGEE